MENDSLEKELQKTIASRQKREITEIKQCKVCGFPKKRILDGTFDGKNKRWRDTDGRLWNGHVCGECHVYLTRKKMRTKRERQDGIS